MILCEKKAPGVTVTRHVPVFGYDDAPHGHGEVLFEDVRVPASNMLLGEGRGFEIAQGRLGPGRIHHCMRVIGVAERALERMCQRLMTRTAFGKKIYEHSLWEERIADARIDIECSRLLTLKAAHMMDTVGNKVARAEIAMIKVKAPNAALGILDHAIQAHGGGGVSEDFGLAKAWASVRTLRLADGPDEVHRRTIARIELKRQAENAGISLKNRRRSLSRSAASGSRPPRARGRARGSPQRRTSRAARAATWRGTSAASACRCGPRARR